MRHNELTPEDHDAPYVPELPPESPSKDEITASDPADAEQAEVRRQVEDEFVSLDMVTEDEEARASAPPAQVPETPGVPVESAPARAPLPWKELFLGEPADVTPPPAEPVAVPAEAPPELPTPQKEAPATPQERPETYVDPEDDWVPIRGVFDIGRSNPPAPAEQESNPEQSAPPIKLRLLHEVLPPPSGDQTEDVEAGQPTPSRAFDGPIAPIKIPEPAAAVRSEKESVAEPVTDIVGANEQTEVIKTIPEAEDEHPPGPDDRAPTLQYVRERAERPAISEAERGNDATQGPQTFSSHRFEELDMSTRKARGLARNGFLLTADVTPETETVKDAVNAWRQERVAALREEITEVDVPLDKEKIGEYFDGLQLHEPDVIFFRPTDATMRALGSNFPNDGNTYAHFSRKLDVALVRAPKLEPGGEFEPSTLQYSQESAVHEGGHGNGGQTVRYLYDEKKDKVYFEARDQGFIRYENRLGGHAIDEARAQMLASNFRAISDPEACAHEPERHQKTGELFVPSKYTTKGEFGQSWVSSSYVPLTMSLELLAARDPELLDSVLAANTNPEQLAKAEQKIKAVSRDIGYDLLHTDPLGDIVPRLLHRIVNTYYDGNPHAPVEAAEICEARIREKLAAN